MAECAHTVSQGREGEKGSWCVACGEQVLNVESRECGGCRFFYETPGYPLCRKHHMRISKDLHVTFNVENKTCWTAPVIEKVGD